MMTDDEQALTRTIGQRLRALRQGRELSLQQLAERTDGALSTSRISNYEQGVRRFSVATALVLADALTGVSAAYLLCLDRGEQPLDNDECELLQAFRNTDQRRRGAILSMVEQQGQEP